MEIWFSPFLKVKDRPYLILGMIGFLLIIFSFVPGYDEQIDINAHDKYIVISVANFYRVLAILMLLEFLIYVTTKRLSLLKWMTWVHVLSTTLPILTNLVIFFLRYFIKTAQENYLVYYKINGIYTKLLLVFFLGQITFLINILIAFFRRVSRHPAL